jgi:hypothetical protein
LGRVNFGIQERCLDGLGLVVIPIIVGFDADESRLSQMAGGQRASSRRERRQYGGRRSSSDDPFAAIAVARMVTNLFLNMFRRVMAHRKAPAKGVELSDFAAGP